MRFDVHRGTSRRQSTINNLRFWYREQSKDMSNRQVLMVLYPKQKSESSNNKKNKS